MQIEPLPLNPRRFFREFQKISGHILFAIHDKTRPSDKFEQAVGGGGCFAGTIALINTSIPDFSTEVGFIVFQDFQRTHVFSNAAGLLINYCLNLPSDPVSPGFVFAEFSDSRLGIVPTSGR